METQKLNSYEINNMGEKHYWLNLNYNPTCSHGIRREFLVLREIMSVIFYNLRRRQVVLVLCFIYIHYFIYSEKKIFLTYIVRVAFFWKN